MFCRLLIIVFLGSLCWSPAVSRVIQKRAAFYIANETMCIVDGEVYRNGDPVPTDDECERCTCRPPGFSCVLRDCDTKPGCKAVRKAGECCPEYVCGCVHNSRLYEDGELIKDLQNNCYTCRCHGSSISCTFADCLFRGDCQPEYIPGECCPRYDHCPTQGPTTSTTTPPSTMHIIQQELDIVNLTTQHLEKFTSEGTTVTIEDIASGDYTTPADVYTVKFTLSGDKISSIHDFDTTEITTLLPIHTGTYKETIEHITDSELTTLKSGLVINTYDKTTTEILDVSIPNIVTESVEPHVNTDDVTGSVDVKHTSDFYDSNPDVTSTKKDTFTTIGSEVSESEAILKPIVIGESSTFSTSQTSTNEQDEKAEDLSQVFIINESEESNDTIDQESSYLETELDTSSPSEYSTHDDANHVPDIIPANQKTTTDCSEASPVETSTEYSFDLKPETGFTHTTIDDETVTRDAVHDDLQTSSGELHTVSAPLFTQTVEITTLHPDSFDGGEAEHKSTYTPEEISLSTEVDDHTFEINNDTDHEREITTTQAEEISSTQSNELHPTSDSSLESVMHEHGKTTDLSSGNESGDITVGSICCDNSSDIAETLDSAENSFETTSHDHEITSTIVSKHSEASTGHSESLKDAETQTSSNIHSLIAIHSHESSSTHASTVTMEETSLDAEEANPQTSAENSDASDALDSVFKESSSTEVSSIIEDLQTFQYEHISESVTTSTDFSTISYKQDPTTESDSSALASTTTDSSTRTDVSTTFNSDVYEDAEKVTTDDFNVTSELESETTHNSEYSVSENSDSSADNVDYKTKLPSMSDIMEDFETSDRITTSEKEELAEKSVSDNSTSSEIDEVDAESQEITTTSFITQKIFNISTDDETLNSLDTEMNILTKSPDEESASTITDYTQTVTDNIDENKSDTAETSTSEITEKITEHSIQSTHTQVHYKETQSVDSTDLTGSVNNTSELDTSTADLSSPYSLTEESHSTKTSADTFEPSKLDEEHGSSTPSPFEAIHIESVSHEINEPTINESSSGGYSTVADTVSDLNSNSELIFSTQPFSQEIKSDTPDEKVHVKPDLQIHDIHGTTSMKTAEPIEVTNEVIEVEKLPTTTEGGVPVEFEPPLANILKQQMLFKRPATEKEITTTTKPVDAKYNIPLDKPQEIEEERLPLTVEETTEYPHNNSLIDGGYEDKIFVLNHDYTVPDTEINIPEVSVDEKEVSENIQNNLISFQTEGDSFEKSPTEESPTTSISEKSSLEDDSLSPIENYNENDDLSAEIMDSEELNNETVSNENDVTDGHSHDLNLLPDNLEDNVLSVEQSFPISTTIQNMDGDIITDQTSSDDSKIDHELHSTKTDNVYESTQSNENTGISIKISKGTIALLNSLPCRENATTEVMSTTNTYLDAISDHTTNFISTNEENTSEHLDEVLESGTENQNNIHETVIGEDFISTESDVLDKTSDDSNRLEGDKHEFDMNTEHESAESTESLDDVSLSTLDMHSDLVSSAQSITHSLIPIINETSSHSLENDELHHASIVSEDHDQYSTAVKVNTLFGESSSDILQQYETTSGVLKESNDEHTLSSDSTSISTDEINEKEFTSDITEPGYHEHSSDGEVSYEYTNQQLQSHSTTDSSSLSTENIFLAHTASENETESISDESPQLSEDSSSPFTILEYIGDLFSGVSTSTFSNDNEVPTTQLNSESEDIGNESDILVSNITHSETENETQSSDEIYSSRLKEEMAGYGSLGGVIITGKSKYNGSSIKEQTENPDNMFVKAASNALTEEKINLDNDNSYSIRHSYFNNNNGSEEEMDAEEDESMNNEKVLTYDIFSTIKTSEEVSTADLSTVNTTLITEIESTYNDTIKDVDMGEITSEKTTEISEQVDKDQLDTQDVDDALLTRVEIKQQEGPEKGGEWFEATDPDLSLANAAEVETTSDANTISDDKNVDYDLVNETDVDRGPEKGGDVFEPPFPEVFPISNENPVIKIDTTINSENVDGSTPITTAKSTRHILDESIISSPRSSISETETTPTEESIFKSEFIPPLPIWLKNFNKLNQKSNDTLNDSKSIANRDKNENSNMNEDYLSDEESSEVSSTDVFGRSFEHSYHLSDVIAKVFKAPGYDSEIYLSPSGNPSSRKSKLLRLKRDALNTESVDSSSSSSNGYSDDTQPFNNKNILLVEGYGQKPSGFFPVTSSFIVVHSDEENETDPKREAAKSKTEGDVSVVEILKDDLSTNPKKEAKPDFR